MVIDIVKDEVKPIWYNYSAIKFTAKQMYFLVANLELLRIGIWPPMPESIEQPDKSKLQVRTEATFARPASIAAEVDWRLNQCDGDQNIFLAVYKNQIPIPIVAKVYSLDIDSIDKACRKVIRYITGWRRKPAYRKYNRHGR